MALEDAVSDEPGNLTPLRTEPAVREALAKDVCVLYKHSPICMTSGRALRQVLRFAEEHPATPVYLLDVISERPLARRLAEELKVRHQSPQAILLVRGRPVWHASHWAVTTGALARQLDALGTAQG